MHPAAISPRGGGVAPKTTRLRGQSIIEYALIAAIIGLVVVFAGPRLSGAVRNQFNQVTDKVDSGTGGDGFLSAEEKAHREAMKAVTAKEAKDWTLEEQKVASDDIAEKGTSSVVYAKAKAAMDAGTTWSVKLTDGKTMHYRIIGIHHDNYADGTGRAGLTFQTTNSAFGPWKMNATDTNTGGWEKSELRAKMNSGEVWHLLPSDFRSKVRAVSKLTNNVGGVGGVPSPTSDRLFLLSSTEVWGDVDSDGSQYELYAGRGIDSSNYSALASRDILCTRSIDATGSKRFKRVLKDGSCYADSANYSYDIHPAFCF